MTDQEVKEKLEPKKEPNAIYEVKTYTDRRGFEVREIIKVFHEEQDSWKTTSWEKGTNEYYGQAILTIETGHPQRPIIQHPVQFKFPNKVENIQKAFDIFESEMEKEISRQKDESEKQRIAVADKELIVPNTVKFKQ
jgi:hypothetical protein